MCGSPLSSSACDQGWLTRNATTAARTGPTTCRRRRVPAAAIPGLSRDGWGRRRALRREDLVSAPKDAHRTAARSAKSSPAGSASQRPSLTHRTPVRAKRVRAKTSHSVALRDPRNAATLHVRCDSSSPLLRSHPSDRSPAHGGSGERCNPLPGVSSRIALKTLGRSCDPQVCSIGPRHAICGKQ